MVVMIEKKDKIYREWEKKREKIIVGKVLKKKEVSKLKW